MKLKNAKLKSGEIINFGDFNIFVGGNGVGKTTILSEIFHKATSTAKSKYWWISDINSEIQNLSDDLRLLANSLEIKKEGTNLSYFSNAIKNIHGDTDLSNELAFYSNEIENIKNELGKNLYEQNEEAKNATHNLILKERRYVMPFINFSSCDSRLNLPSESSMTSLDSPPTDSINVLYRNNALLKDIDDKIFSIFKIHFILLSHLGNKFQIGISKETAPIINQTDYPKKYFKKIEEWKEDSFTPINEAGHGIRSMIKLLTNLLEPTNQIILIDEPELHLYPYQKRWLGKQLVSLSIKQKKQVFLVTHDPIILQGILDDSAGTNIFRIDKDESGKNIIHSCELNKGAANHSRNQEQYLQGLFYRRCIIVEGASDGSFYKQMFEKHSETLDKDLGIIVAGSVGHSKHIVDMVVKVKLKAAFIYDLDVLFQKQKFIKEMFEILGGKDNPIKKIEAALERDGVVNKLSDEDKIKKTKEVTGYTEKYGFSEAWGNKNKDAIIESLLNLEKVGIFIVPGGTLESWAPEVENKIRFAENAPEIITNDPKLKDNLDSFTKKIMMYLNIQS